MPDIFAGSPVKPPDSSPCPCCLSRRLARGPAFKSTPCSPASRFSGPDSLALSTRSTRRPSPRNKAMVFGPASSRSSAKTLPSASSSPPVFVPPEPPHTRRQSSAPRISPPLSFLARPICLRDPAPLQLPEGVLAVAVRARLGHLWGIYRLPLEISIRAPDSPTPPSCCFSVSCHFVTMSQSCRRET